MAVYVPAARPDAFIPNDSNPRAGAGITSQVLDVLVNVTVGVPILAESVEVLFAVVPVCITEKERLVGENDNVLGVTIRVTARVALVYPLEEAVTVEV